MNRLQRIARFNFIVVLTALVLSGVTIFVFHFIVGLPIQRALGGFGFIGICGLTGFSNLIYRKKREAVSFDERDLMIQRKATIGAYSIFWFLFVLAAMIPFFVLGPDGVVSVKYLAAMVFGGMTTVMLVQSIVTLEEYGWRNNDNE